MSAPAPELPLLAHILENQQQLLGAVREVGGQVGEAFEAVNSRLAEIKLTQEQALMQGMMQTEN